jgi:hypothetical protein
LATQSTGTGAQIGGSARGYQGLSAPVAIPATAEQAGGQAVCLCIASAGCERPLLPQGVGRIRLVCSQLTGTVSWWLTWLIFHQIGMHR